MQPVLALALLAVLRASPEALLDAGLASHPAGAARAVWATRAFLGARYLSSPLGEEAPPDQGPRFRLDAFDCTTLVETAIALGNAGSVAEARALLDDIRYDGPPSFAHRNHYVLAEWLPANRRKGWIEEVTSEIAGDRARRVELRYTTASWRSAARSGHLLPHLDPALLPTGAFAFSIVPLAAMKAIASAIPEGTLVAVVRTARPDRPYRVTHLGLVVVRQGVVVVRHASPARMRVVDEPLERFIARASASSGWKVEGLSLWAIRSNPARARELKGPRGE